MLLLILDLYSQSSDRSYFFVVGLGFFWFFSPFDFCLRLPFTKIQLPRFSLNGERVIGLKKEEEKKVFYFFFPIYFCLLTRRKYGSICL